MKKSTIAILTLVILSIAGFNTASAQVPRITVTIAGNGTAGYSGDGGWGKLAAINGPYDVCTDAAHNVYFTDPGNGRIRKVAARNGVITTVAGGGTSTADGIPAVNAVMSPRNICLDAAGNIYAVDSASNKIKRIDAVTNIITTVAGTGTYGYSGDGGPAVSATFNSIYGICADPAGNIYLVDQGNFRVRKITAGTGIVTTIAGIGTTGYTGDGGLAILATLYTPTAICVTPAGDVVFVDQSAGYRSEIRKISTATGVITTIAGSATTTDLFDVLAMNTWLGNVTGLCVDGSGDFYFNEISCSCRKMENATDSIYPVDGDFTIESFTDNLNSRVSYMDNPYGICADASGDLYIADNYNNRIRKVIQLTHTPTFAYGEGEYMYACPGATVPFDSLLTITDLDSAQTETWTVISAPSHGSLSGFPATAASLGQSGIVMPSGPSYNAPSGYAGSDSFQVQVSDGTYSDIVTIYISIGAGALNGPVSVCTGATISLTDDAAGGSWSTSNANATISSDGIVFGMVPGTDIIAYSINNSCGLVTSESVITIDPVPDAGAITATETSVCTGTTITLADAAAGGVWSAVNSHSAVSGGGLVTGITAGTDTILYSVTNACGTVAARQPVVVTNCNSSTAVGLVSSTPAVNIFPNPASSTLNVAWAALQPGNATIIVTDVTSREVLRTVVNNNSGDGETELNLSGLKEGVYILTFNSETAHFTNKFVVSK